MFSIGELSRRTGVKIPTIRYYEQMKLLSMPERSQGNQRRYTSSGLERLGFIKHARDLGFSIEAISALIKLGSHPDKPCADASRIARDQLQDVRDKIVRLKGLETELTRISKCCTDAGATGDCNVLAALSDHSLCMADH